MKFINTKIVLDLASMEVLEKEGFWYDGPVDLACGPSDSEKQAFGQMKDINAGQADAFKQAMSQAQEIFGNSSKVFNDLVSSFSPVLAAGPNQEGYSPAAMADLNSRAITDTGNAYRHAAQAAGERGAALGGGQQYLPSGTVNQMYADIAQAGAGQTANQLGQIRQASRDQGRSNWLAASQVLSGAPGVFSPATSALNAGTGAGTAAQSGANQVFGAANTMAQQSGWWKPLVGNILGGAMSMIPRFKPSQPNNGGGFGNFLQAGTMANGGPAATDMGGDVPNSI